jgi:hypothetical protein
MDPHDAPPRWIQWRHCAKNKPTLLQSDLRIQVLFQRHNSRESYAHTKYELLQPGVFRFGLLEYRDAGVGVFPEREEILVGAFCLGLISRQDERSAQL